MADDSIFEDYGADSDFGSSKPKAIPAAKAPKKVPTAKAAPKSSAVSKAAAKPKATTSKKRPKPDTEDEDSGDNGDAFDDESLLDNTPPKAKKAKQAPKAAKATKKPLADVVNETMALEGLTPDKPKKGKRVSEQYQMISHLEHIIKRPDTYIGSIEKSERQTWVYNTELDGMEFREVTYVPGLYKIFDEILVNAADNKQNDKNMDEIKVSIDQEQGEISVWNNGRGIPIEIHSKQQIYIPEMIFGNLLSSSNYDDDQQKVTGGRNGYGAKLCNIFSTEFTVETVDSRKKKKYKQTWTKNMSVKGNAKITDFKGDDYTKVTFKPDFAKFGMTGLDADFAALAKRRVYDLAGTMKGVAVRLNNSRVPVRSFTKYMEMYTKGIKRERGEEAANDKSTIITESSHARWEIGFAVSDGSFQQVSFVNSIATTSGGTHVNYISDQICTRLAEHLKKKNKGGPALKINQIKNHLFLFVNCQIVNPAFTSQTKEQLTTKSSQFGSTCTLSDKFMKQVQSTEVIQNILAFLEKKADQILKKTDGNKRSRMNHPKLIDANKAGAKDGWQCTLILTEGDSAKGLAVAGRSVVSPDLFGVFPLRGKLLNVRDASIDQISKNAEIQNIKNFMGLQHKKEYTDTKGLRYGHLMIMTDQDHDGSHIKGLLINFLQVTFPSLLKLPGFLLEFITPIVKTWKGTIDKPDSMRAFYTMPEYEEFKERHKHEADKWDHKYFKGLGTSTTQDAQEYFSDLDRHLKRFHVMREHEHNLIDLAFSKKRADERKGWLGEFKPGTYLDHGLVDEITYDDFVNKELILFSMADNIRSIPSVVDGFKPGQRKVMYTCLKRNLKKDVKVAELAGSVSEITHYSHGDVSLQQTIVGLAQTFVGSNNVNCLVPSGNFGSRLQGGSDAASARYIFTRLSPFAKKVFHPADQPLLTHNMSDATKIEPQTYIPVVPMVLVNGADGIGTGWSSQIPNYNPEDIVANLKRMMSGEGPEKMQPWFRGFRGTVEEAAVDRYKFSGSAQKTGATEVEITELPIRVWTQDFKEKLEDIIKADKVPSFIKDYRDYNTHDKVRMIIQMEEKYMPKGDDESIRKELEEKFKLSKSVATSNLVAFDAEGRIAKYASVEDILKEFFKVRIMFYEKRKQWMLDDLQRQLDRLNNQARFIQMIIDNKLVISRKKKIILMGELKKLNFRPFPKIEDAKQAGEQEQAAEDSDNEEDGAMGLHDYDYLLGMPLWSLTQERVEKLRRQIGNAELEVDALIKLSKEDLWNQDLDAFIEEWRHQLDEEHKSKRRVNNMGRRTSKMVKVAGAGPAIKKRKGDQDSDNDFEEQRPKKKAAPKVTKKEVYVQKTQTLLPSMFASGQGTMGKNPPRMHDGNSSEAEHDEVTAAVKDAKPQKAKPAPKAKTLVVPDDSDEEVITKKPARKARAAAAKPVRYGGGSDSDDSNGDDFLGDITSMVKGLPKAESSTSTDSKALFSTSRAMPNGSTSLKAPQPPSTKSYAEISDDDETNFMGLVPQQSPRKSINVMKNSSLTDDEEDEDDFRPLTTNKSRAQPAAKSVPTVSAKASADDESDDSDVFLAAAKPRPAPAAKPAKAAPKKITAAAKKDPAPAKPKAAAKATTSGLSKKNGTVNLSPAAKAYAAKQARNLAAKENESFDAPSSDEESITDILRAKHDAAIDVDAMADDLLDSPVAPAPAKVTLKGGSKSSAAPKTKAAPKAKPAPKAAAKPKAPAKAKAKPKKKADDSDLDIDIGMFDASDKDVDDEEDEEVAAPPKRAASARPARRAAVEKKKPVYVLSDDDDEEDEEGGGFQDDDEEESEGDFGSD